MLQITPEEKSSQFHCGTEHPYEACFCMHCGTPLNQDGVFLSVGWNAVIYNILLPGSGHRALGMKKLGTLLIGLYILFIGLSTLESSKAAMNLVSKQLTAGTPVDARTLSVSIRAEGRKADFYFWLAMTVWAIAIIDSLRIRLTYTPRHAIKKKK